MMEEYRKDVSIDAFRDKDKFLEPTDPKWKKGVMDNFGWIADYIEFLNEKTFTPAVIANISDEIKLNYQIKNQPNPSKRTIMTRKLPKLLELTSYSDYSADMNWMDLFLKLSFENFLDLFIYNPDFKKFYEIMKLIAPYVKCLCIQIGTKKGIKSGYHWITALFTHMTSLTSVKLYSQAKYSLTLEIVKCIQKGVNNFTKAGGNRIKLEMNRFCMIARAASDGSADSAH